MQNIGHTNQQVSKHMSHLMMKPTKWHVRPGWSESSLSAWRKLGSLATHWAHCQDSDQTGQIPRLIQVFAGRTDHFGGFVTRRFNYDEQVYATNVALHFNSESYSFANFRFHPIDIIVNDEISVLNYQKLRRCKTESLHAYYMFIFSEK